MLALWIALGLTVMFVVGFVAGSWYVAFKMAQTSIFHQRGCGAQGCVHVHQGDYIPRIGEVSAMYPGGGS